VKLHLPSPLRTKIIAEARAAAPRECCGLIEGEPAGDTIRAIALHPTANLADDPAAGFEIDPAIHIRLRCALRGSGRSVVGCYHSHPNGRPTPSERDRACGSEQGFVWIIAAVMGDEVTLTAFEGPEFSVVDLLS
jgi:proteasome lid subunit RPN8/RPN11